MPFSDYVRAGDIKKQSPPLMAGQDLEESTYGSLTGYNGVAAAANVWTNTITANTADTAFSIPIRDANTNALLATVSGTSSSGISTAAEFAADIVTAWEDDEDASGLFSIARVSDALTATARATGKAYTISSSTSGVTSWVEATSEGIPAGIRPGRVVMQSGSVHGQPNVAVASTARFSAQVKTFTVAGASGDSYTPVIRMNGVEYVGDAVEFNTDVDTTATDLATEVNAIMPAETVIATTSTADLILTAEVEGAEFEARVISAVSGEVAGVYTTGPSAATSLRRAHPGVALYQPGLPELTLNTGDGGYRAYDNVPVRVQGQVACYVSGTPTIGQFLYVGVGSGDEGNLYTALSTDRIPAPWLVVRAAPDDVDDGVYVCEVLTGPVGL